MVDVSLEDEIKKDRVKGRKPKPQARLPPKRFNNRPQPRSFDNRRQDTLEWRRRGPPPREETRGPLKTRIIRKKDGSKKIGRSEVRQVRRVQRRDKPFEKRPSLKQQKRQERQARDQLLQKKQQTYRTLKVMGLSPQFTNEDLYKLFATEGALEKCLIEQDNFGRSLTTALVKYHNHDSAVSAIKNLNKHKIMNCILTVEQYKFVKK